MNLLFWGMTLSMLGKVLIASAVIMAHGQIAHEHRIDAKVIRSFHKEKTLTIIGILLVIAGYFAEVHFFGGFGTLFTCTSLECAASLGGLVSQ